MGASGLVFHVQKFSLNDGPGIRTVVFFKGCPLRCKWCSNPESQCPAPQPMWEADKCLGCGACAAACGHGALEMKNNAPVIGRGLCWGCLSCEAACPARAIRAAGEWKTTEEVVRQCEQDIDFYEESGGGVTLSGGEPLFQPEFAGELLRLLKERGIRTAIETTGFASEKIFAGILPSVDLLLFDMKHWDEHRHIEGTGVSNGPVLRNMASAIRAGKDVLPRIPVIPGYNDESADAAGFVRRLREAGATRAQLLPFHQFGENKYTMLSMPYAYGGAGALHEEDLAGFRNVFLEAGIDAFF